MSDFERRLRDALAHGAESAVNPEGLAAGARSRRAARRRRTATAGAALAIVLIAVPVAVLGVGGGSDPDPGPDQEFSALEKQQVTCGQGSWPASAMDGGLPDAVDDQEVRTAFARVLEEAPMDAPEEIRKEGPDEASYITLAAGDGEYTLGTGTWSTQGPDSGAQVVGLELQDDGTLRVTGWGDCDLRVAIPEGRSPVAISAPPGRVHGAVTDPVVMVREQACTSGRDPRPFLGEPQIVADDQRVLVTITSKSVTGNADCPGNPSVPVTLDLDEPIGDRELLDGGTWPPTPIKVAPAEDAQGEGWRTVEHEGVQVDVPANWERLDNSECGPDVPRYGPRGSDPCGIDAPALRWAGAALFDPAGPPGLSEDEGHWVGYVFVRGWAVNVRADDHAVAQRILGSVREKGREIPDLSHGWRTVTFEGLTIEVPEVWQEGGVTSWCADVGGPALTAPDPSVGSVQGPDTRVLNINCRPLGYGVLFGKQPEGRTRELAWPAGPAYPDGAWIAIHTVGDSESGFRVIAPTRAIADLVVGSVQVAE